MPVSGYTMLVAQREVVDLDLAVEQAVEYIVSCGLVLPPQRLATHVEQELLPP